MRMRRKYANVRLEDNMTMRGVLPLNVSQGKTWPIADTLARMRSVLAGCGVLLD
jgi:hypothetical protein